MEQQKEFTVAYNLEAIRNQLTSQATNHNAKRTLVNLMCTWEDQTRLLKTLESMIEELVLPLETTVDVGNVRATYSKGRDTLDHAAAVKDALLSTDAERLDAIVDLINKHTTEKQVTDYKKAFEHLSKLVLEDDWVEALSDSTETIETIDYQAITKKAKIEPVVVERGTPNVKVKLLD